MRYLGLVLTPLFWSMAAQAVETSAQMHAIDETGIGAALGTVAVRETAAGIELVPRLRGLPAGPHGFHLHEKPACEPGVKDGKPQAGLAAGGHYDPDQTGQHLGPDGHGHKGDLPMLTVAADGAATLPVTAARLKLGDLQGRALVIHAAADNYADQPGGARIACGVLQQAH